MGVRVPESWRDQLWRSNHGWRARIGVIYPGVGWHHIDDFHKIAPEGVAIGGNGVPFHKDESVEEMLKLDQHVVEVARGMVSSHPDVILWCCTAGSFLRGKGHDQELIREMEKATGIPCTTTATAVVEGLKYLGASKICLCTPYPDDANQIEKKFLEDNGFQVPRLGGLDLIDLRILGHLSPNVLYRLIKDTDCPETDAIFISCTGLDALGIIEPLEQDLGKPVITSNHVSYWLAFKMAGVGDAVHGYGRLMSMPR